MGRVRNYLLVGILAACLFTIAVQSLPSPRSTDLDVRGGPYALVDYRHILEARENRWWYIFTQNANIILASGTCLGGVCAAAGKGTEGIAVGAISVVLALISAGGKSYSDFDARVAAAAADAIGARDTIESEANMYRDRFIAACDKAGLHDSLPLMLEFGNRTLDQVDLDTPWGHVHAQRRQVVHPIKRDMRSVIRIKVPAAPTYDKTGNLVKRQDGEFYGIEGYVQEDSDYGYPPNNGWLDETAQAAGKGMHEYHMSGAVDMCAKIENYDTATAYAYFMYDGTEDNEQFDQVFGCDTFDYGE